MNKVLQLKTTPATTRATRIRTILKERAEGEAEVAALLREELDELGEVNWLAWCDNEFGWARSTAYRHLNPQGLERERENDTGRRAMSRQPRHEPREDEALEEDEVEDPQNYRTMYFLRAEQAARFAFYSGPIITADMVVYARTVAAAWEKLARTLETSL